MTESKSEILLAFYNKIIEEVFNMKTTVKTGQKAPVSGQYRPTGSKTEVTFVQGKTVPPTTAGKTTFTLVDQTKHKGG